MIDLYIASDNSLEWNGLRDPRTLDYISDATVTATLKTELGVAVSGAVDIAMTYVSGSNGRYQGIMPYTALGSSVLSINQRLWLEVTAAKGTNRDFRRIGCVARYKGVE